MKNQKSLGNKGFSLVELIVVIAIMAVLMGVLAPTLIGNIEKSRESKDLQNLDAVYNGINTALAEEAVVKEIAGANKADYAKGWMKLTDVKGASTIKKLEEIIGSLKEIDLTSACNASAEIYVNINPTTLKVMVMASNDGKDATVCTKTESAAHAKGGYRIMIVE